MQLQTLIEPSRSPIVPMCQMYKHITHDKVMGAIGAQLDAPHLSLLHFRILPALLRADISTLFERPLSNNSGSHLSQKEKEDLMSDTFVHFCANVAKRPVQSVHL